MPIAKTAFENLEVETGITLESIPDSQTVTDGFARLTSGKEMSLEAETAILYRIVAMRYIIMMKEMMDSDGELPTHGSINFITQILDMSVEWSELAPDHVRLESIASNLNRSLESMLQEIGVRRG